MRKFNLAVLMHYLLLPFVLCARSKWGRRTHYGYTVTTPRGRLHAIHVLRTARGHPPPRRERPASHAKPCALRAAPGHVGLLLQVERALPSCRVCLCACACLCAGGMESAAGGGPRQTNNGLQTTSISLNAARACMPPAHRVGLPPLLARSLAIISSFGTSLLGLPPGTPTRGLMNHRSEISGVLREIRGNPRKPGPSHSAQKCQPG